MNLKILTAAMLFSAAPAFAAGSICIVCPPGYDCSTGTPAISGTTGQVLTRTENGPEWQALPESPAMTWDNIADKPTIPTTAEEVGAVPATRKVAGKALTGDITLSASDVGAAGSSHNHAYYQSYGASAGTVSPNGLNCKCHRRLVSGGTWEERSTTTYYNSGSNSPPSIDCNLKCHGD